MASVGIPKYALVPLFILWFGIDDAPKLWLVGLLVFYPIFIAVFAGIRNVDRRLIDMARVVGASEAMISREVIWNSLLPFFFAALKIALPRAISAAIIGEFLVGNEGLGYLIEYSRQNFDTVGVFAGIVVATALVLVINALLAAVDRRFNAWRPVDREMELYERCGISVHTARSTATCIPRAAAPRRCCPISTTTGATSSPTATSTS